DVLDDVAIATRQHRRREPVAVVARGEVGVVEVADLRHRAPSSIEISPRRPIEAVCPGHTKVVESASLMIAGPAIRVPAESAARSRSGAASPPSPPSASASYSTFSTGTISWTR